MPVGGVAAIDACSARMRALTDPGATSAAATPDPSAIGLRYASEAPRARVAPCRTADGSESSFPAAPALLSNVALDISPASESSGPVAAAAPSVTAATSGLEDVAGPIEPRSVLRSAPASAAALLAAAATPPVPPQASLLTEAVSHPTCATLSHAPLPSLGSGRADVTGALLGAPPRRAVLARRELLARDAGARGDTADSMRPADVVGRAWVMDGADAVASLPWLR